MPFHARIGINTGHASVGDFGSDERTVYSAIGVQVNIAARIQEQCPPDGVLMADTTWHLVRNRMTCRPFGELELKGLHYRVPTYLLEVTNADRSAGQHTSAA
jgi:class 3 adenylate cyclase